MALRYAVASGNWSSLATWDGGASLPAPGDDVYTNSKTVTINQSINVASLRNSALASPVIVAGGQFTAAVGGITITADIVGNTASIPGRVLEITAGVGSPVTTVGTIKGAGHSSGYGVLMSGTGVWNHIGNCYAVAYSGAAVAAAAGTANLTGNCYAISGAQAGATGVRVTGGVVNITGDCYSTAASGDCPGVFCASGTLNVYGTAYGSGVLSRAPGVVVQGGTAWVQLARGNNYPNESLPYSAAGVTTVVAGTTAAYDAAAFSVDAVEHGSGGMAGAMGRYYFRLAGVNYVRGISGNLGTVLPLGEQYDYPAVSDVRMGVVYGYGFNTGTCAVPPAGSVAFGVPVDDTTGTAVLGGGSLTAADVWAYGARALTDKAGFAPSAADNASAVRTELATELARVDENVSAAKTLTGAYDAAMSAATSAELTAAVSYILANLPAGITPADVWAHATRSLTQDVGLSPSLTARLENCATVQTVGDQLAAMGV